jgi:hypothetical protein
VAKSNARKLLKIVHIVISDDRTSDKVFSMVITTLHMLFSRTFETMTYEWNYLILFIFRENYFVLCL